MEYKEIKPSESLHAYIKCFWTLEDQGVRSLNKQRIVPDGCMEMIFHHGDLYRQYLPDGNSIIQPRSFVFGQITQPLDIEPIGTTRIFGVRFYPEGYQPFSTRAILDFTNKAVSLDDLYGKEGLKLQNKILTASSTEKRIEICESFFLTKVTLRKNIDEIIQEAVSIILNERGRVSVSELTEKTKIQRRHLERKFASVIGLSPKQLAKVIRLKSTINLMFNNQFTTLTSLAYEGEYYDQAHFIKDFKEFTGQTPKNFYADNLKMSALFHKMK